MRGDIRSGLSHVSKNAQVSGIFGVELIALAVFIGWYFHSILLGAATLIGLILIWKYPIVTILAAFIFTAIWGYLGWFIGTAGFANLEVGLVLAGVGLFIGYIINLRGLGFIRGLE
ncbi:MAG: hypothetical protein KO254_04580 [Methanoculleus marisnigri]|uniref:Uncharacterized protein n=1 Tax=Methanoculleus marisnigri (strain ATCC 35101 / DSM 1498 / JR1) TaxID=368407 RepID=A3CWP0_METMJ|nr:hypothetical protein Memar_1864 [Methanoculleus marisnigri JR1]MCC7555382.1 hypothetical protein [Methanoculleus marisnigri]